MAAARRRCTRASGRARWRSRASFRTACTCAGAGSSSRCGHAMESGGGLRRRKAQAHVVRRPAPVGAAEVRPELRAYRLQQRPAVARGGEEALPEGLEPVAEVARERRRARDERDLTHDETLRLEPRAVLVVAR